MTIEEEGFEEINVKVPKGRIGEFYQMYGRWLSGAPTPESNGMAGAFGPLPWDPATDGELAIEAWKLFPERAQRLFSTLMDRPGERFSGDQLAEMHDIPNGVYGVAGVLAWPGRNLKKLDRTLPISVTPNDEGGSWYSMEPEIVGLFTAAREAA